MADAPVEPTKVEEVSLEDIDKILEAEDPEFKKELEAVRVVEIDKNVEIETGVADDDDLSEDEKLAEIAKEKGWRKFKGKVKDRLHTFRVRMRARMSSAGKDFVVFLKTRPKEFILFAIATIKVLIKKAGVPFRAFSNATGLQKLTMALLGLMVGAAGWILLSNFKGIWIPQINEPILKSLEYQADSVENYNPKEQGESFYAAFPQERHEFLFQRMKVNLRRTRENPNPMGAFEIIVLLDSKDTAIEARDREVEFFDYLQRVFEEETFADLESEAGKGRLKTRLKREMNQKLTQGWVKDINFKTFVLKP